MAAKPKTGKKTMSPEQRRVAEIERMLNQPGGSDFGTREPLLRGDRKIEPESAKGAPRRAVNVSRLELTDAQENAAETIRTAFLAVTAGLFAKAQNFERVDRGAETDHMATATVDAIGSYRRWAIEVGRERTDLVLSHVMDGRACRELDREHRWRDGTSAGKIRADLDLMAAIMPKVEAESRRKRKRFAA